MIEPKDIVVSFRTTESMNRWLQYASSECKVSKGLFIYALLQYSKDYFKDKKIELTRNTELEVK